jgi:glycosyltransferase involved in cell wall biosynthesis
MRICYASTWKVQCGISTYGSYMVSALKDNNPDIFVLAEDRAIGGPDNNTVYPDVQYKECWDRNKGFNTTYDVIKQQSPDIVHWSHEFGLFCLNQDTANQYIKLLENINRLGIKQTITYHSIPFNPNTFFQHYFDLSTPYLDKIIVHTAEQMSKLIKDFKVPQDKIKHINHGTKLCELYDKQEARQKLNMPKDKKIIMSMGFFGGLKGVDELIAIEEELIKVDPSILFYFVGGLHFATAQYGKDYMKKCFRDIVNKGLKDKFIITGFVNDDMLPYYYAASDLAVLNYKPSGYLSASGCSAKLVGSKRLIITTAGTHRNDEIRDKIECIKTPWAEPDKLKDTILSQINKPDLNIINNAYKYAQDNSWANIASKYLSEVWA